MTKNYTRSAFKCILIPIIGILVFLLFLTLASITEFPTNRSGIYIVFAVIAIVMMFLLPAVNIVCAIIGIVFQAKALRNHESRGRIIALFVAAVSYILISAQYCYLFYLGIMSV